MPQAYPTIPNHSQSFPVILRRSQAFSGVLSHSQFASAIIQFDPASPTPTSTRNLTKKAIFKRRPLLVGLPGFVLRKVIFEVEPILLKKGADRRSSNKSLSYRLNHPPRESGSPTTEVTILSYVACKNSLLLCECSAMCCLQQSKHYTCIDARRAFASAKK